MTRAPAESALGPLFADVLRLLRRDFQRRSAGLGITPALARLLLYCHRAADARQVDLALRLDVTPVTLGRMVDRLVARGLVERRADPCDGRASRIRTTAAAAPLAERLEGIALATRERALSGFNGQERQQLIGMLQRLEGNLAGAAE